MSANTTIHRAGVEGKRRHERQFPERASDRGGRYLWSGRTPLASPQSQPLCANHRPFASAARIRWHTCSNPNQKASLNVSYKASYDRETGNGNVLRAEGALGGGRSGVPPGRRMSPRVTIARATITTPTSTPNRTSTLSAGAAPLDETSIGR